MSDSESELEDDIVTLFDPEGNDEESVAEEAAGNWRHKDVDDEDESVVDEFGCKSPAPNGLRLVG